VIITSTPGHPDSGPVSDGSKHDLSHDHREKSVFSSLEVLVIDASDDFVTYACEGNNSQGSTRDTVNIQVLGETQCG
jgi:hypothetical protein